MEKNLSNNFSGSGVPVNNFSSSQPPAHIKKNKKPFVRKIILIILILILVASIAFLTFYLLNRYYFPQQKFEQMKNYTLQQAHEENPDCTAWLKIEDTMIDYPVMETPSDFEYYLHRNFQKEDSYAGTPFFGQNCKAGDNSMLIHGHNMRLGTMFHDLEKFTDSEFFNSHTIYLETLDGEHSFQPIVASYIDLTNSAHFRYYDYVGNLSEKNKTELINKLSTTSFNQLSNEELFQYTNYNLVMLSTCSYNTGDERLVVLGRQIS